MKKKTNRVCDSVFGHFRSHSKKMLYRLRHTLMSHFCYSNKYITRNKRKIYMYMISVNRFSNSSRKNLCMVFLKSDLMNIAVCLRLNIKGPFIFSLKNLFNIVVIHSKTIL